MSELQSVPLSLYVHLPWCVRKCPYCDFNSHAAPAEMPRDRYIDALLEDLDLDAPLAAGREITSIFFGGGTPSLFHPDEIGRFLEGVRGRMTCAADTEVTLEANPGTIEHGRFCGYREAGINRVSLGAQSLNDRHLHALGRIHGAADVARAVDELVTAGLSNFNIDLMYALPQQTLEEALQDVRGAIALHPAHLSHYQLTLEPGTVFHHRPPPLPDDDSSWEMQLQCQQILAGAGYVHYEVSAYAQPGSQCRHNLNYWEYGDYLGIGAGAHGKITHLQDGTILRTVRCRQPRDYLARAPAARLTERKAVADFDKPFEFMLNALRLIDGFDLALFESRTGLDRAALLTQLHAGRHKALIDEKHSGHWQPTALGMRFLNDVQAMFLP